MKIQIQQGDFLAVIACESACTVQFQVSQEHPFIDSTLARSVGTALLSMADAADVLAGQVRAQDNYLADCTRQRRLEDAMKGRG